MDLMTHIVDQLGQAGALAELLAQRRAADVNISMLAKKLWPVGTLFAGMGGYGRVVGHDAAHLLVAFAGVTTLADERIHCEPYENLVPNVAPL